MTVAGGQSVVLTDGWIPVNEAWTYASASTINVPTGATNRFQKYDKIRFKQGGGYKYFNATTVAAALITVAINNDYTVANSAITDIAFSRADPAFGFPSFFNFTPSFSSQAGTFTLGTLVYAVYSLEGGKAHLGINFSGTQSVANSNYIIFGSPFTSSSIGLQYGPLYTEEVTGYPGSTFILTASSVVIRAYKQPLTQFTGAGTINIIGDFFYWIS